MTRRAAICRLALDRRAAEAATLRIWVATALAVPGQERRVILTGGLNDTVQAATTQLLLGRLARRSVPVVLIAPTRATIRGFETFLL